VSGRRFLTSTRGALKGYTADFSESGISAVMRAEVPLGELAESDFGLLFGPVGPVTIYAAAAQKTLSASASSSQSRISAREVIGGEFSIEQS
jgi:hypothetical protein